MYSFNANKMPSTKVKPNPKRMNSHPTDLYQKLHQYEYHTTKLALMKLKAIVEQRDQPKQKKSLTKAPVYVKISMIPVKEI